MGPTLSFRGFDNLAYYWLKPEDRRFYENFSGCGNAFDLRNRHALQLVADSLRYWVTEMHVDGFRFDLATTLARESGGFDAGGGFLDVIGQDPVLANVKLIAEPWDIGLGGYQVGQFPPGWSEWNDQYRDTMRAYWKGDGGLIGDFAQRLTGSSDLYGPKSRGPFASVNFITAHDGFTLHDLVSYNEKHNEANGEENRDGNTNNVSWNPGVEGPTDDPEINRLREQQERNFLATLLFSQGLPMLLGGDEMGRTQNGNNNAYCQDSEIAWVHWDRSEAAQKLIAFTARLAKIRREHPLFRRREFFHGRKAGGDRHDIRWLQPTGEEMTEDEWNNGHARSLGVHLFGDAIEDVDTRGKTMRDTNFVVLFNAHHDTVPFTLPAPGDGRAWYVDVDTAIEGDPPGAMAPMSYELQGRSLVLLRQDKAGA
jgi:glycogen operon protein